MESRLGWLGRQLAVAIIYGAAYMLLRKVGFAHFVPASGLKLAVLLLTPRRYWPALLVSETLLLAYDLYDGVAMPFLQIGEHKYGKPILDRAVSYQTDLYDTLKIGLISMDSTMRSNLSVGLPIDIVVIRRDELKAEVVRRIEQDEPYFHDLRARWSAALLAAHKAIPRPPYGPGRGPMAFLLCWI